MDTEQQPGIWSFVAETAPLAASLGWRGAVVTMLVLFGCTSKSPNNEPSGKGAWQQVRRTANGSPSSVLAPTAAAASTASANPVRLPPIARCQRLPPIPKREPAAALLPAEQPSPPAETAVAEAAAAIRQGWPADDARPGAPLPAPEQASVVVTGIVADAARGTGQIGTAAEVPVLPDLPTTTEVTSLPDSVERQGRERLAQACTLADRGALYAAREECEMILHWLVQSLDIGRSSPLCSTALERGLLALTEAEDFFASPACLNSPSQLAGLIAGHETAERCESESTCVNPQTAIQTYYQFASQELGKAGMSQPLVAEILFTLGRLEMLMLRENPQQSSAAAKAAAFFTAALNVDPHQGAAANELGVLLARSGRLVDAHAAFEHAVRYAPTETTIQNLAEIRRRCGSQTPSGTSKSQPFPAQAYGAPPAPPSLARIHFVDPQTFVRLSEGVGGTSAVGVVPPATSAGSTTPPPAETTTLPPGKSWFGL